jgi:FkbM family methyltransferase
MRIDRFYGHSVLVDALSASSIVVDLGSNNGNFALAVARRFLCKPFCVEPNPNLYQALASNSAISAFNLAIATRNGHARLFLAENPECSSLLPPSISKIVGETGCQAVTLQALLDIISIDYVDVVKVDIEGLEVELLISLDARVLDRISQLTVEFHESIGMGTIKQVRDVIDHLKAHGFGMVRGSFFDYSDVLFLHKERLRMPSDWWLLTRGEKLRNGISRRMERLLSA